MHTHFDDELTALKERVRHAGTVAEQMARAAVEGLVGRDPDRLSKVLEAEREADALQLEIDNRALDLIARHQPMAGDLRFLVMATKIGGELERIADQAVNIAQNAEIYLKEPPLKPLVDLPLMTDAVLEMLHHSLDSFIRRDAALARKVLTEDDRVDAFKRRIFGELLACMKSDPAAVDRALCLLLISRNLERIGDHATNVAEEVIYWAEGRDVRHQAPPDR